MDVFLITHILPDDDNCILGVSGTDEFDDIQTVIKSALDNDCNYHKLFLENGDYVIGVDDDGQWDEVPGYVTVEKYAVQVTEK